ncbi:hypothetical protein GCM10010387_60940 [Streptomyces inusitatus]|uniref:SCO1431 family membrane protein n=2 Tax=Streptomyces inusitatus TaxID=68221 RepID=A0A918QLH6_9ACTN|nr:hypothetical protein GCM10010387_60940 [Streptomyces inusitatus]
MTYVSTPGAVRLALWSGHRPTGELPETPGEPSPAVRPSETAMTSATGSAAAPAVAPAVRTRTGGPDDRSDLVEHIVGWTLVVVLAMLVTRLGLI